jgi:hypothetical protein
MCERQSAEGLRLRSSVAGHVPLDGVLCKPAGIVVGPMHCMCRAAVQLVVKVPAPQAT